MPCGYSVSMVWKFDPMENKHDTYIYKDENCMKKF